MRFIPLTGQTLVCLVTEKVLYVNLSRKKMQSDGTIIMTHLTKSLHTWGGKNAEDTFHVDIHYFFCMVENSFLH